MFQLWKILAALGVFGYEIFQVNYLMYLGRYRNLPNAIWLREMPRVWLFAATIGIVAFAWAQVPMNPLLRWLVVLAIFATSATCYISFREPRIGFVVALFCEAFTAVAIAATILYLLPASVRAWFE